MPPFFSGPQLALHFQSLGLPARVLDRDDPELPKHRFWKPVWGWVALDEGPIDLVGCSPAGTLPLSLDNVSVSTRRLGFKIPLKGVRPIQFHFVIRRSPMPFPPHYRAELVLGKKGRVTRDIVSGTWKGGGLARRLQDDSDLRRSLLAALGGHERLEVRPDDDQPFVRMVLRSRIVGGVMTLFDDGLPRESGMPDAELWRCLCAVAEHIRQSQPARSATAR